MFLLKENNITVHVWYIRDIKNVILQYILYT